MTRALVTGASGDIGSAICRRLAADGLKVIVHANRNAARAEALAESIRDAGASAEVAVFDVTNAERTRCVPKKRFRCWSTMPAFTPTRQWPA